MGRGHQSAVPLGPWCLVILLRWYSCTAMSLNGEQEQINCSLPPLDAHPKDCCQLPSLIDESLLRNCKSLHGGEPLQRTLIYERGKCFVECALNATGTMVNGLLDQARIMSLIEAAPLDDPALIQLFQGNTLQCLHAATQSNSQPEPGCSKLGADFVGCMNIKNFLNCPQQRWSNTEQCNSLKQFIQHCPRPI